MPRHGDRPQHAAADQPAERDHLRPVSDPRRERLENLRDGIHEKTELRARVVLPSRSGTGTISLNVVNPHTTHMYVDIGCDLVGGEWWLTWDLSEDGTLGPADGIDGAVSILDRVLMVKTT